MNDKWHSENAEATSVEAETSDHAKCIRQLVQIAARNAKSHSSLLKEDPSTARSVTQSIGSIEYTKNVLSKQVKIFLIYFLKILALRSLVEALISKVVLISKYSFL